MGIRRLEDLMAWRLADAFKQEVFRLLRSSPEAWRDLRFRSQLVDCSSAVPKDIAEGFFRYYAGEICNFTRYALASLGEAERTLHDGIQLTYFKAPDCETAFRLCRRCAKATSRWRQSLEPFRNSRPSRPKRPRRPSRPTRPVDPRNPVRPKHPADPADPVDLVDPVDPVDLVDLVDPADPGSTPL